MSDTEKPDRFEVVQFLDYFATVDYEQRVFRLGTNSQAGAFVRGYPRRNGKQWRRFLIDDALDHLRKIDE